MKQRLITFLELKSACRDRVGNKCGHDIGYFSPECASKICPRWKNLDLGFTNFVMKKRKG